MLFFAVSYLEKADSERAIGYALGAGVGLINAVRIVRRFRSFSLQGDELIIRQMLRKEIQLATNSKLDGSQLFIPGIFNGSENHS